MPSQALGDRMKQYERSFKRELIGRMPTIIRLDGKAFHTYTRSFERPFDENLHSAMIATAFYLMFETQNAVLAYTQSDEISILLNDWKNFGTQQWFGGQVQKMVSVSASAASVYFNRHLMQAGRSIDDPWALFDSRVFQVPKEDVTNYFVWRQQDASRNSVQMLGRAYFSHKALQDKNNSQIQDMLMEEHGVNWNDLDTWKKRGSCVRLQTFDNVCSHPTATMDTEIPIFTQDRQFIEQYLTADEE